MLSIESYLCVNPEHSKANAISDNLAVDLNITNDDVNTGISVYHFVFTIFTLPSNAVSKAVGAHLWIPTLMSAWAVVTWAHAFIHVSFCVHRNTQWPHIVSGK